MKLRTLWRRTLGASLLAGSLAVVPFAGGQKTEMAERMLSEMSPEARAALETTLKEQGMTLDSVRNNPKMMKELLSGEMRRSLRNAVEKKVKESSVSKDVGSSAKSAPQFGKVLPPMPPSSGAKASVSNPNLPARYQVIFERNLFRPLGWGGDPWQNPFTLIGLVGSGGVRKAIISKNGQGLYVGVGETVGDGYRVARIEGNSVQLSGGSHGELTIQMDAGMVGLSGGSAPVIAPMTKQPEMKKGDGKWRPVKGTPPDQILKEVLSREGLRMEDMKNPAVQKNLESKYGYLQEEGYAPK